MSIDMFPEYGCCHNNVVMGHKRDCVNFVETCHYCKHEISLVTLKGFGDYWCVRTEGDDTRQGAAVCPSREDAGHSPVEENDDDPA